MNMQISPTSIYLPLAWLRHQTANNVLLMLDKLWSKSPASDLARLEWWTSICVIRDKCFEPPLSRQRWTLFLSRPLRLQLTHLCLIHNHRSTNHANLSPLYWNPSLPSLIVWPRIMNDYYPDDPSSRPIKPCIDQSSIRFISRACA